MSPAAMQAVQQVSIGTNCIDTHLEFKAMEHLIFKAFASTDLHVNARFFTRIYQRLFHRIFSHFGIENN